MNISREVATSELHDGRGPSGDAVSNIHGARLLIVDDELAHRSLMSVMLMEAGMQCKTSASAADAMRILEHEPIDAVIADLNMPGVTGLGLLAEVRRHHPQIVFLMATGEDDVRRGVEAMRLGADDYLVKPVQAEILLVSLERAFHKKYLEREVEDYRENLEKMVGERTLQVRNALRQVEQTYADTVDALGAAIDLRDQQTAGHSRRVTLYAVKMLKAMNGLPQQLKDLAIGASLHDIGKLGIPDAVLLKPGPLTDVERQIMQRHVEIGYELVKRIPFLAEAAQMVLMHHERCNGTGYPRGLKGPDISLSARVFAVADSVDAITSDRPYRSGLPFEHARMEIERQSGTLFDPEVTRVFLSFPNEIWQKLRQQAASTPLSTILAGL